MNKWMLFALAVCLFGFSGAAYSSGPVNVNELGAADCPENTVFIAPGTFIMGCSAQDADCQDDEFPAHGVKITDGFCMDKNEVTNGDYKQAVGKAPALFKDCDNCPVEQVTWNQAKSYCEKAGKRLPTEAEWEYAARGGKETKYFWGSEIDNSYAWYADNSQGKTNAVGTAGANAYGLNDMLGNVWEWTQDCYDPNWYSSNKKGKATNNTAFCGKRILRGGSWASAASSLRVSARGYADEESAYKNNGFRCVKDFTTKAQSLNEGFVVAARSKPVSKEKALVKQPLSIAFEYWVTRISNGVGVSPNQKILTARIMAPMSSHVSLIGGYGFAPEEFGGTPGVGMKTKKYEAGVRYNINSILYSELLYSKETVNKTMPGVAWKNDLSGVVVGIGGKIPTGMPKISLQPGIKVGLGNRFKQSGIVPGGTLWNGTSNRIEYLTNLVFDYNEHSAFSFGYKYERYREATSGVLSANKTRGFLLNYILSF